MKSPFPGMDPYTEACGYWEDFHDKLVGDIERHLSEIVPERYAVRLRERAYIVVEPSKRRGSHEHRSQADVSVTLRSQSAEPATATTAATSTAVQEEPVWMTATISTEYNETFIEIHGPAPERALVTTIEVLSPSNKRPGTLVWRLYRRKRQAHLQGLANLVEIDLVRRGRRMPMEEEWPESPYYVRVGRKEGALRCCVWPGQFARPLPKIPVPLLPDDPDVELDLQRLVDGVYARGRYDLDYTQPCRPRLSKADVTWLAQRLESVQSQGL
jgi:hypothetical protein